MSAFENTNVLVLGGSQNIGYYASQKLLAQGATVTFMLRRLNSFDNDESMKPYLDSGKARVVQGDALNKEDVQKAYTFASEVGKVDIVLFTVGGKPKITIRGGAIIDPKDLCTRASLNLLRVIPREESQQPKLILLSSTGLSKKSHANVPLLFKPMYSWLLAMPHADKLGMERVVTEAAGWQWTDEDVAEGILPDGWKESLAQTGAPIKHVVLVRPAMLTDGESKADAGKKNPYRAVEEDLTGYTISRKDTAHFIVEGILKNWSTWENKKAAIAY